MGHDARTLTTRPAIEPLLRELVGHRLRELRLARGERLVETAARAGVSPQYLSEVERGLKEPSSEMIAAIAGALGTGLLDLTEGIARDLRSHEAATGRRAAFAESAAVPASPRHDDAAATEAEPNQTAPVLVDLTLLDPAVAVANGSSDVEVAPAAARPIGFTLYAVAA
ncbi:helix-turn-helix transcriptional regulator [Frondihabitans sp. PAMC 28766]|uniref:helix-turn-helix domain-containing protein n=1 Tax=Frondihabitans sp. PAMC 28766 TaxID=1795630 RepID=UPI0009EBB299